MFGGIHHKIVSSVLMLENVTGLFGGGGGVGWGGTGVPFCMQPGKNQENYILAHGLELFRTSVIMVNG